MPLCVYDTSLRLLRALFRLPSAPLLTYIILIVYFAIVYRLLAAAAFIRHAAFTPTPPSSRFVSRCCLLPVVVAIAMVISQALAKMPSILLMSLLRRCHLAVIASAAIDAAIYTMPLYADVYLLLICSYRRHFLPLFTPLLLISPPACASAFALDAILLIA